MCLAIPGKVVRIVDDQGLKMGDVDYSGAIGRACLEYVPEVKLGEYVIVHAGFALSIIDEEEARKTLLLWDEIERQNAAEGFDRFGQPIDKEPSGRDRRQA